MLLTRCDGRDLWPGCRAGESADGEQRSDGAEHGGLTGEESGSERAPHRGDLAAHWLELVVHLIAERVEVVSHLSAQTAVALLQGGCLEPCRHRHIAARPLGPPTLRIGSISRL